MLQVSDPDWRDRAECARRDIYDPDAWFDDRSFARAVCRSRCPVIEDCLVWALDELTARDGSVAGGLTEGERRILKRRLRGGKVA